MRTSSYVSRSVVLFGVVLLASAVAPARTFEVVVALDLPDNNPGNGFCVATVGSFGVCTLRAAVEEANAYPGHDVILVPDGTFVLESQYGQLTIEGGVSIHGYGAWNTVIETDGFHRMFEVESGVAATIAGMTLRGAAASGLGGAIVTASGSSLAITRVWFDGNSVGGSCGALAARGSVTVRESTFSHNAALSGPGGAVCVMLGADLTVINSTFFANAASSGGAIHVATSSGSVTLLSSTLIDNTDTFVANGISPSVHLDNGTLHLDKNLIFPGYCYYHDWAAVSSDGGNAEGPSQECVLGVDGDQVDLTRGALHLGSLGNYGGPVPTMLPGTLSVAVDPPFSSATCPSLDARGEPRSGQCDVGAAERQVDDPESGPLFIDDFESGDTSAWQ